MYEIEPGTLTAGTVKINFKGRIESFIARKNAFSFMNSVKRTPTYCKQILHNVLIMVKQLGIVKCFLTSLCAE